MQPSAGHYNNLQTSGYKTGAFRKSALLEPEVVALREGVWEHFRASLQPPGRPRSCRHSVLPQGRVSCPSWPLCKLVLVLGGQKLEGRAWQLQCTGAVGGKGMGRVGKGHTGDESCPKPNFIGRLGFKDGI